ncbi:uncharacterized protein BO97DRAFT_387655 [Aspergillus homomorphus CBS 101889]|uniref:Biogenesis of lysosome-related organelles complex 1 subunit 1 n=1 Tax=Aspergillus homomorphus (strain CBS 101889) TaxID=1450537 RepID=A0A395I285_ASPHC|nr:hypothetical protein BO97DRAFT_387655 [Aspergillus homomorphus CBS 101889]RAL13763.1 hypothetical protein BO97DRAFT_387655 [Aspergillus homomorphus CBS 101889]
MNLLPLHINLTHNDQPHHHTITTPPKPITHRETTTKMSPQPTQTNPNTKEEAKTAFTATLRSVAQNHEAALRDRARTLNENARALDAQETALAQSTAELAKQNDQWDKVADTARTALKEIGDVQNWAEVIERELLVVEEALLLVESKSKDRGGSGGFEGEEEGEGFVEEEEGIGNGNGNGNGKYPRGMGGWFRWW